jgi:hypothetical protein
MTALRTRLRPWPGPRLPRRLTRGGPAARARAWRAGGCRLWWRRPAPSSTAAATAKTTAAHPAGGPPAVFHTSWTVTHRHTRQSWLSHRTTVQPLLVPGDRGPDRSPRPGPPARPASAAARPPGAAAELWPDRRLPVFAGRPLLERGGRTSGASRLDRELPPVGPRMSARAAPRPPRPAPLEPTLGAIGARRPATAWLPPPALDLQRPAAASASIRPAPGPSAAAAGGGTPPLVWRSRGPTRAAPAIAPEGLVSPPATARQAPPVPPAAAPAAAAAAPAKRDPLEVDRLADEIMGRIERRLRIERERRGL